MSNQSKQRPIFPECKGLAIVACSSSAPDEQVVQRGLAQLRDLGFELVNYAQSERKYQRFGATDIERADQIHAAFDNDQVDFVLALRGGYGVSRLLPLLDFKKIVDSRKILIGHSDLTALQLALLAFKPCVSFAAPMLCDDFGREDVSAYTMQHFMNAMSSRQVSVDFACESEATLDLNGMLWGSNLAMLTHLLGSDYFPKIDGGILFLEDIGEHPYKIERMLLQLHFSGVLKTQQALVLGDFSGYRLVERDNGYDFDETLKYLRSVIEIPILTGLPFGHIRDKVTLLMGAQAQLKAGSGTATLTMRY